MYCHECGSKLERSDRYCGNCGTRVLEEQTSTALAVPEISVDRQIALPQIKLGRRAKLVLAASAGLTGALLAGYGIAHYTYGPSTPEALHKKLQAAVEAKDADALVRYLDPEQKKALNQDVLAAVQGAFDERLADVYTSYFERAAKVASANNAASSSGPVAFIKEKNWRGSKYSFRWVRTASVQFNKEDRWTVSTSVGSMKKEGGFYEGLWPGFYAYEALVENGYGGRETVKGTLDLTGRVQETVDLRHLVQTKLVFVLPVFDGVTYTLNGAPLDVKAGLNSSQEITLRPAPAKASFKASGKLFGLPVDSGMSIVPISNQRSDLTKLFHPTMAGYALDTIYSGAASWAQAVNAGDPSLMKSANPNGDYYKRNSKSMEEPADNKITLDKVAVDPDSIRIDSKGIYIQSTEQYSYEKEQGFWNPSKQSVTNNQYFLQPNAAKDGLWISSSYSTYGSNLLESDKALKKDKDVVFQ
jgi:hypothetical protein